MRVGDGVFLGFLSASFFLNIPNGYSLDCNSPERMSYGPCIECQVGWSTVNEILDHVPMFWDTCFNEKNHHPVIHYFPTSLSPRLENNRRMVQIRKTPAGEWILSASLMYQPEALQGSGILNKLFQSLQLRYHGVQFINPPPDSVDFVWLGQWPLWIKNYTFETPTGLEPNRKMRLYVVFKKEYALQVQQSLKRPLGILARITFKYSAFDQKGSPVTISLPVPLNVGNVSDGA